LAQAEITQLLDIQQNPTMAENALIQRISDDVASIVVSSLSGNLLSELQLEVEFPMHEVKKMILLAIASSASYSKLEQMQGPSKDAQLKLFYDGNEVTDDGQHLSDLGINASEQAHFTALIYDPRALVLMEITALHREAIERSHQEASAARRERAEMRKRLIAQRQQQADAEHAACHHQADSPLLMIANGPANPFCRNASDVKSKACDTNAPADHMQSTLMLTDQQSDFPSESMHAKSTVELCPCHSPLKAAPDWRTKASEVAASYDDFFNHISFRKGWREPPFVQQEVAPLFISAAGIVARVRIEILDARDEGIKLRKVDGSACDWMHSSECSSLLQTCPNLFLEGLVHATFKDGKGYVEGLSKNEVDSFIRIYK
jgi:hypothetical protein